MNLRVLALNPGSTSTEVALFVDDTVEFRASIEYTRQQLASFSSPIDQYTMRMDGIREILRKEGVGRSQLSAVVARGGLLKPMESGTYRVTLEMVEDVRAGKVMSPHISNIGPVIAYDIAHSSAAPAFIADPVSVDEFEPLARISGMPEIGRKALQHTLNIKAVTMKAARTLGKTPGDSNFIVAHLGGGISVCPVRAGKIIDANNANEEGPFSPERTGGLPSFSLAEVCFSGRFERDEILRRMVGQGGLVAYLGTNKITEVERRIEEGDEEASLVYEAMAYQIAKEIGGMATVLSGKVDRIILTGGCAHSDLLTRWIEERVSFIAPVSIYPGNDELTALAAAAFRVLRGEEKEKAYK
jgi:butyrate kinase